MNTTKIRCNQGFTLIELISVVAIMAITLGFGLPSFRSTMAENRLTASVNDMVIALQLARSTSIKQVIYAGVSIDSVADGSDEWYVFRNVSGVPANVMQRYSTASGVKVTATDETPRYRSDGRLTSAAPITISFTLADGSPARRTLTIAPSGRVSVTNP
ncbi:GspH/FimT family pseudopilin [Crenothrix sp.]|uniref:GspH/FimT family pseudopilin n=1 Tax=Crenothrix sp. TaxID=3100433 RepID=UPI00374CB027